MSRIQDKLDKLQIKLNTAQAVMDGLEDNKTVLEAKLKRSHFKRDRKQHRKKLIKDPMYRASHRLMSKILQDLYWPKPLEAVLKFTGLSAQLEDK